MKTLTPLDAISVPPVRREQTYHFGAFGRSYSFSGLRALLGAADFDKAGDRNARLSATTESEREAARDVLSGLTLEHLYVHPLCDGTGRIDSVMRANYDVDREIFSGIAHLTVGELRDRLLANRAGEAQWLGRGLTGVMAAAVVKLCDVHDLVYLASRMVRTARARTVLGEAGSLSSRLQPNHPTDDPRSVKFLLYQGLSIGAGDALLGINPAIDTVENVSALLRLLDDVRTRLDVPTQICVLAHIKTQLASLEQGAPVEILFQSLGGTERTNLEEFDITVALLDEAYQRMEQRGPLRGEAAQWMYFETGQGSEFTYGKHNGMDMTTAEALCYGLARRYDPFMVNNVTGFIGPETHLNDMEMLLSNLQDHCMGKLLGLPMGMAPCYTLHSQIGLEGQQVATELLTAAGANYYMDVFLNTDRMLAYFDTSGHDVQTMRELHGKRPASAFEQWALQRGIFERSSAGQLQRGEAWGHPERLCSREESLLPLVAATPAMHGIETAGPRLDHRVSRAVRLHQAIAREAIFSELDLAALEQVTAFRLVRTAAGSKLAHVGSPELGARLEAGSAERLEPEGCQVQIIVSDGLSAAAVHHNIPQLLPVLLDGLAALNLSTGLPILAPNGRVKLAEPLLSRLETTLALYLIGERPGGDALAACSLSAYLVLRLPDDEARAAASRFSGNPSVQFEYSVLSNIYSGGLPPLEAGAVILEKVQAILAHGAAGNRLEALLGGHSGLKGSGHAAVMQAEGT